MPNRWIYFHPRWPSLVAVIALAALVLVLSACSSTTTYEDDSSYEIEDCDAEDRRTGDPDCAGHTTRPRTGGHGTTTRPKTTKPKSYSKPRTYSPPRSVPRGR